MRRRQLLKFNNVKSVWRELSASKFILTFAVSQALIMTTGLFRIRILANTMNAESIGIWLFWVGLLSWGGVICAPSSNSARLFARNAETSASLEALFIPNRLFRALVVVGVICTVGLPLLQKSDFAVGAGITVLTFATMLVLSPHFGYQQGAGRGHEQSISNAVSSVIFFFVSWWVCVSRWWIYQSTGSKIFVMTLLSCLSMLGPFIWAGYRYRRSISIKQIFRNRVPIFGFIFVSAATLPPAFISGFDTVALLLTQHSQGLGSYGIASRLSLVVLLVPSAMYVQVFNRLSDASHQSMSSILKLALLLTGANIPFVLLFLGFAKPMALYLSHNKISISHGQMVATVVISLLVPIWICLNGAILADEDLRSSLGQKVIVIIIPTGIVFTLVLAYLFGAPGPLYASIGTYTLSTAFGYRIFKGRNLKLVKRFSRGGEY